MREIFKSQAMKKFLHNKKAMLGLAIVVLLVLAVLFIPLFKDMDPYTTDRLAGFNSKPSAAHPLGTDDVGRDLFARLLYGGRISLFVGIMSTIISVAIGIPLGLIAGYFRGPAESIIMRTADAFMSFPSMVLILVLVAVFGPSILTVTVVIGILGWTAIAKLIYGNVLSIREREYIQATKAVGMKTIPILFTEVLPNAIPPVWANISFRVAGAILTESSLSFLGMGVQTPQASWGNIIYAAQNLMVLTARPWVWIPPGLCIILVVVGFNFIGEGVRESLGLDPAGTLYHPCSCRFQFYR
jgi:peptide/nickel transport system permease protein